MSLTEDADLIIGVDTHLDTHTAAICDARGRVVSQLQIPATTAGYVQLLAWARSAAGDRAVAWAVEGTRHYGLGLARYLAAQGEQVSEIDCSRHIGKRRAGKSDPIDAVRAARELLARPAPAQMRADGDREALRLLMIDRDNAVQSAKTARTALAAVLVTAPAELREQIRPLPRERRAKACAALTCPAGADRQTRVLHQTLIRLGQRIAALADVAAELEAQITEIVEDMAPGLVAAEYGLGYLSRRADPAVLVPRRADPQRTGLRDALRHRTRPRVLRPDRPAPAQPARRPPAQPRHPHHRRHPHALPPAHPGLHPAPPRRRKDRPRNPPLHQALPRPPPLPNPHQRHPQQRLTNIGASSGGSTSTRVHPRRSPSSRVPASPPASAPVAVLSCCTAAIPAGSPSGAPDKALTSANPAHQVTGAPTGVHVVKKATEAGPSPLPRNLTASQSGAGQPDSLTNIRPGIPGVAHGRGST